MTLIKSWTRGNVNLVQVKTSKARHLQHWGQYETHPHGLTYDIKTREPKPWVGLFLHACENK